MEDGIVLCMRVEEDKLPFVELSFKDIESRDYPQKIICVECASEMFGIK